MGRAADGKRHRQVHRPDRREHRARLRDARIGLHQDINTAARSVEQYLGYVTDLDATGEPRRLPTQPGWATLDARIELLATEEIKAAFHAMHRAWPGG